ncbi:MAG: GNAT family N-acetyltransferase [Ignavibacteriales bacterium]|nr:GNAT family N-acetyltransferase [Ignavibacteriales bacterium]
MSKPTVIKFKPLTTKTWNDFEEFFGKNGACGGCWCMWWHLTRSEFNKNKGEGNKKKMKKIAASGNVPGLLFYINKEVIAWCSLAPRENFPTLEKSRILKRVDDKKVWSLNCFFIKKGFRRNGISLEMLNNVIEYVGKKKGKIIEGYPVEPKKENYPSVFAWTGYASSFRKAGFEEVIRRSPTRPIMRYYL